MASQFANSSLIELWNSRSMETISFLQSRLLQYEWWIVQSSIFSDNRLMFTFFFPFITGLMNSLGVKALWAAILSEWSNLILKWLFKGDRPYWWVQQTNVYSDAMRPNLRQFANTCESGPGTPSGHIMINVALFYVIMKGILRVQVWGSRRYRFTKLILASLTYTIYVAWIATIFISRLYIQAHFIHQCIFGVAFGLIIGHISWSSKWLVRPHAFSSTVFANMLAGSALVIYGFLQSKGLDPLWAVPLAMKHCWKPEFVFIDTQPYYIMVRFSAMALGLGFAISSKRRKIANTSSRSVLRTILTITVGLLLGKILSVAQKALPQDDLMVYLGSNLVLQLIFPYLIVALVPYTFHVLYSTSRKN